MAGGGELGLWRYTHWGSWGTEGTTKRVAHKGQSSALDLG